MEKSVNHLINFTHTHQTEKKKNHR